MIALGPTDSINAGASTAAVVNYTVQGEAVGTGSGATPSFSVLASGQLTALVTRLYTPGTSTQALISRVAFYNTSGTAVVVTVAENLNTTATMSIPANGFAEYEPQSGWVVYNALGLPVAVAGTGSTTVTSVNTRTGAVVLKAADVAGGASGTANQILATDGSGNGSWVNAPAGASAAIDVTKNGLTPGAPGTGPDCTAALKSLLASSVAAAQANGTNYVELYFPPGVYNFTSAPTQGGTTHGNAQVPFPIVAATAQKVIVVLRGVFGGADSVPHWNQTVGQKAGTVFYTTWTGSYSSTYGRPSVIGGPTKEQGWGDPTAGSFPTYPQFNNIHIVIDGIVVVSSTTNPTMTAFDFQGMAQMTIGAAGALCDAPTLGTGSLNTTFPTNNWAAGLYPPNSGNNDLNNIRSWSCEGYYMGIIVTEHCWIESVRCIYCNVGIAAWANPSYQGHANWIGYASMESCGYSLVYESITMCFVELLDIEHNPGSLFAGGYDISDGNTGNAHGRVGFVANGPGDNNFTAPVVNGCNNLKIICLARPAATINVATDGLVAPPASGTAQANPYYRDALATCSVSGGGITAIVLNQATGNRTIWSGTSTAGPLTVPIPSGASVTFTYTGTLSWVWSLL